MILKHTHRSYKFKDLEKGGWIYVVDPMTSKIHQRPILEIKDHTKKGHIMITFNQFKQVDLLDTKTITKVTDFSAEIGKALPSKSVIVKADTQICITIEIPPLVYASDKLALETWMKNTW